MTIAVGNVTTSPSAIYTSSGNTVVTFLSICNYTGTDAVANVWVVPNGSSATNATAVINTLAVGNTDTYQFYAGNEKLILGNGDTIQINASADNLLTTVVSYTSA
jgi:hypothetical protein